MEFLPIFFLALISATASEENSTQTIRSLNNPDRIINGEDADPGQFPYQVGLSFKGNSDTWNCGGSLLSSTWLLTAAHCTEGASVAKVLLGGIYRNEPEVSLIVYKQNFIQHEGYFPDGFKDDIALIKIPRVKLTKNIQKVYLPIITNLYPQYTGKMATVSGWGFVNDNRTVPSQLKYAVMEVISNRECVRTYDSLTPEIICTKSSVGSSTCSGDSGGPLVLSGFKTLIGVTSFGMKYCENGYPSGFTRVTSYLDWIAEHTGIEY